MKATDIIGRAGRSLRQSKVRTLLTSLAIGVGAFTICLSLAAGEGARQYANKLIESNIDPQALFVVKDKTLVGQGAAKPLQEYNSDVGTARGQKAELLSEADIDSLRADADIVSVQPIYDVSAQYVEFSGNAKKYSAALNVYDPSILNDVEAGKLPPRGTNIADNEVTVPKSFIDTLGGSAKDLTGKTVTLTVTGSATATPSDEQLQAAFTSGGSEAVKKLLQPEIQTISLKIRAVYKGTGASFSDSNALQISNVTAKQIAELSTKGTASYQKYFGATAIVKSGVAPATVKDRLQKNKFVVQTAKDLQGFLFTIVNTLQGIVLGFGLLALVTSVFGIVNTQYISVLERTQQIGLMKALGMRGRDVSRLFRYEAAWIGFLGGVLGSSTAIIAGTLLNPQITKWLDLGNTKLLIFQPLSVVILIVALMLVAIIAGYFPARKAAKLDPIEALRTE